MAITKIIKFNVKPDHSDAFKNALLDNKKGTESEAGCLEMRLYVDNTNPNLFFVYERWLDDAAFASHATQVYTQRMLALFDSALAEPAEFIDLSDTQPAPIALKPADKDDPLFNIIFIFKIKAGMQDRFVAQFKEHITHTRQEDGNLLFDLYTIDNDDQTLVVYEHWRKESDVWDIHFHQPYAKITGALMEEGVIGDMEQYMNFVTQIA
ncbi:putative quinol monooxygenase [Marinomonas flavescens]|uniref:putative quinol monooxygenase n=1 Tax=Marinomonas flavescens TaxID=2529379 RepID=UPI0010546B54|nr:antibiotic biosynthesis monooxygenase [Marinomonas flavescens]